MKQNKSGRRKVWLALTLAAVGGGLLLWKGVDRVFREPRLLGTSAPMTISLAWNFYACGNDCPYFQVLAADTEGAKYIGQQIFFTKNSPHVSSFADNMSSGELLSNKFVCNGRFELYEMDYTWECCLEDVQNLVFRADTCQMIPYR